MPSTPDSFFSLPIWRRMLFGATGGLALGIFTILIVIIAVAGGRYQMSHGNETDMWALSALYPAGAILSGVVGGICGPMWRSRWSAAPATAVSVWPLTAAISVADSPHGPTPYHIDWELSVGVSLCFGVGMLFMYGSKRMRDAMSRGEQTGRAVAERHQRKPIR